MRKLLIIALVVQTSLVKILLAIFKKISTARTRNDIMTYLCDEADFHSAFFQNNDAKMLHTKFGENSFDST